MNNSIKIAILIAVGATVWVLSGQIFKPEKQLTPNHHQSAQQIIPKVRIEHLTAQAQSHNIILRGRTEPNRSVDIRAEVSGHIIETPLLKGSFVKKGTLLVRLDIDDRLAKLDEGRALKKQRIIEYDAAITLSKKGYRSETKLAEAKALLEGAEASLKRLQIDLERTQIKAPFDGVLEERPVEIGDYVGVGGQVARIVELNPILVTGHATEKERPFLSIGDMADITYLSGEKTTGTIRYIASDTDPQTRTYRIEIEAPNNQHNIYSGLTSAISVKLNKMDVYKILPAYLALSKEGDIGVKILSEDNNVQFQPINIVSETEDGFWVSGPQNDIRLVTVGHEFVKEGQKVEPHS
jgi:membrane fusion protein, multidrug efflux system